MLFRSHELSKNSITRYLQKENLFDDLMESIVNESSASNLIYSSSINNETKNINVLEYDFEKFINNKLNDNNVSDWSFIFYINQIINSQGLSLQKIIQNKRNNISDAQYVEVIGYNLKKYNENNILLQQWFIPNIGDETINLIDTQIKYNKIYNYKLDQVILTLDNNIKFTGLSSDTIDNIYINYVREPRIKIYVIGDVVTNVNEPKKSLGATYTNKLLDYPPIEPEVEFIPYIGVDNAIKVNLNTAIGNKTVMYQVLNTGEQQAVNDILLSQNRSLNDKFLTFQADEPSKSFEVYISDQKPSSYEDMSNVTPTIVSTNNSSAGSVELTITPNKKYYFAFRSIDVHDHFSNPTDIYEFEMINDNGFIAPVVNVFQIKQKALDNQPSKSFKKYIKIQPAVAHTIVNEAQSNTNHLSLGIKENSPWNKNFKLRITSKTTGKKIDINFKFNYKKQQ